MKRILLIVATATMFLLGMGVTAVAYPAGGMYGRAEYRGYFTNALDSDRRGLEVLPPVYNNGGRMEAIPISVSSADRFIDFIRGKLSGNRGERTGASFIVHTMIGTPDGQRYRTPWAYQLNDWEARVRAIASAGRVTWRTSYSFNINSYYTAPSYSSGGPDDDAFWDESGTNQSMLFRDASGNVIYALKWECANPVGQVRPLPQPWEMEGWTTVSDTTVVPNQTVVFSHHLRNNSTNSTSPTDIFWIAQDSKTGAVTVGPANSGEYNAGQERIVRNEAVVVPSTALPGDTICRRVGWDPIDSTGRRNGRGAPVCATVTAQYNLAPQVQVDTPLAVPGQSVTFTYRVANSGPSASPPGTTCKIVGADRAPGYTPLPAQDADRASSPASYPVPPAGCPRSFALGTTLLTTESVTVGDRPVGSLICRSVVVNPKNHDGGFRSSAEVCVRIAKKPYVHFMGNDVWAGGNFPDIAATCTGASNITTAAIRLSDGSTAGSATEYGAFALGRITNFGSAGLALLDPSSAAGKQMTFANTDPNPANLGLFGAPQHCINDYLARFASTGLTAEPANINTTARGNGVWRMSGNHSFRGTVPNGRTQVYIVQDGTVTIDGDLRYSGTYASQSDIPSLIIIATCTTPANCANASNPQGQIRVNNTVQQMDGLFIAKNVFNTCADVADPLDTTRCNNRLTVNGAVIARQMLLRRTFGADGATTADRKRAAEVFNFVPEMYLRSALSVGGTATVETTLTRELPPRF